MNQTLRISVMSVFTVVSAAALAQSSAVPGVPPAPVVTSVPPSNCEKPNDTPGMDPDSRAIARWQKHLDEYKNCVTGYVKTLEETGKAYNAVANQLIDEGNKELTEFNTYAKAIRVKNNADDE